LIKKAAEIATYLLYEKIKADCQAPKGARKNEAKI
jgi:hypothetical protein